MPNDTVERHEMDRLEATVTKLVENISDLTTELRVFSERISQDQVERQRLQDSMDKLVDRITTVEKVQATNQPIIDNIRDLNNKLIGRIVLGFISIGTLAVIGTYIAKAGGVTP